MKTKNKHHQTHGEVMELARETATVQYWIVGERSEPRKPRKNYSYVEELINLQIELIKLQEYVKYNGLKMCVIFEGRDAAGKGGVAEPPRLPCRRPRHSDREGARAVVFPAIRSGVALGR
jgi:polyphosphate kinase 2 (PPK2 family)